MTNRDRMLTKIERVVELEYDQLDRRLTNNEIDQATYDEEAKHIDEWARDMYNDMDKV
jgi:hypothetical protein